jgi:hypothetical protein
LSERSRQAAILAAAVVPNCALVPNCVDARPLPVDLTGGGFFQHGQSLRGTNKSASPTIPKSADREPLM